MAIVMMIGGIPVLAIIVPFTSPMAAARKMARSVTETIDNALACMKLAVKISVSAIVS